MADVILIIKIEVEWLTTTCTGSQWRTVFKNRLSDWKGSHLYKLYSKDTFCVVYCNLSRVRKQSHNWKSQFLDSNVWIARGAGRSKTSLILRPTAYKACRSIFMHIHMSVNTEENDCAPVTIAIPLRDVKWTLAKTETLSCLICSLSFSQLLPSRARAFSNLITESAESSEAWEWWRGASLCLMQVR